VNKNQILPGFSKLLGGRRKKSALEVLKERLDALRSSSISQLESLFEQQIPAQCFESIDKRKRCYCARTVFWSFIAQVFNEGRGQGALRFALRQLQSYSGTAASVNTAGLCKARQRLPLSLMEDLSGRVCNGLLGQGSELEGFKGHQLRLIDATHLRVPDSLENRETFSLNARCTEGCGFPVMRLTSMFDLVSGAWIKSAVTDCETGEANAAILELFPELKQGDIVVADRLYPGYGFMHCCLEQGADFVLRVKAQHLEHYEVVRRLNKNDRIITLKRPQNRNELFRECWSKVPKTIEVRLVSQKGYDREGKEVTIHLMTSLKNTDVYPLENLMKLYRRRWRIETNFRDLKITMGMEALRTQSPTMLHKEVCAYQIAYNLIRHIHRQVCAIYSVPVDRLSVKGTIDTILTHAHLAHRFRCNPIKLSIVKDQILELVARDKIPIREGRWEPRVRKFRNKGKAWMTRPRETYKIERQITLKTTLS